MNKFTKVLVLLSFCLLNGTKCSGKNKFDAIIRYLSRTCFSVDACQPECCKQFYLYSVAKNNCNADIDGQLAAGKWFSPFSQVYHPFWESTCNPNDGSKWKPDDDLLEYSAYLVNDSRECEQFVEFCWIYSKYYMKISICNPRDDEMSWKTWLPISTNILSILLQIFTLLFFLVVPELIQSVRDKCFLLYLASGLVESTLYLTSVLIEPTLSDFYCYLFAFGRQFSGLEGSFLFNVLCLQVWNSLKSVTLSRQSSTSILRHRSLYYAFGCSLAITVITFVADRWLSDDSHFKPIREPYCAIVPFNYALGSAWFQPSFIYYYSIMMILLIIDSVAFIDIVRTIAAREKRFKGSEHELRRHQKQPLGISTYLKLFALMGTVNLWSLVLFLTGYSRKSRMLALLPNFLNGVLVRFIIISRKQVLHTVRKKFFKSKDEGVLPLGKTNISQPTLTTKISTHG